MLEGSGAALEKLQQELTSKSCTLDKERNKVDLEDLQTRIVSMRSELKRLDSQEELLKEELTELEKNQAMLQQVEYFKKDITLKEEKRSQFLNKRNSIFLDMFGRIPDLKGLKVEFKREQEVREENARQAEQEKQKIEADINSKRNSCRDLKKDRAKKTQREKMLTGRIDDIIVGSEDFEEEMIVSKEKIEELRKDLQSKEAGKFTFPEMLEKMEKMSAPACPTCDRGFSHGSEAEDLKRDLQARISEIPRKVQGLEAKLRLELDRLENLQRISPDFYTLKTVKEELAEMNAQVTKLDMENKNLADQMSSKEKGWTRAQEELNNLKGVSEDVHQIDSLTREIMILMEKCDDLKSTPGLDTDRGLEHVRQEEKEVLGQIKKLRRECEAGQDEYNKQNKLINGLESEYNKLLNNKLDIEAKQQQRTNIMQKKTDLEDKVEVFKANIAAATDEIQPMKENLLAKEAERAEFQIKKEKELEALQGDERTINNQKVQLAKLDQSINEYKSSDKAGRLEGAKQDKVRLDQQLATKRAEKAEDETQLNELIHAVASQAAIKRNLEDNVKLRRLKVDEDSLQSEIVKFEAKLANTDFAVVEQNKRRLNRQINDVHADINSKEGKISEMRRAVAETERELNNPKLKNAAREYFKAVVKHSTTKMAVDDLNKYYNALDIAIMRFHKDKMRVVNGIIREMWRKTYRGNDIDHIEIKTDDGEAGGGADKRKTYNYRVVMVKSEVDMDMRGRCSAGQKVLASLIIRLALAETFAESCGIIALDEPTTNLDRENIESLAMALTDIATRQSEYRDFQLVVITHDEEFIEQLSRCDKIQYYQKVSRNSRGISEIRKVNVDSLNHAQGHHE